MVVSIKNVVIKDGISTGSKDVNIGNMLQVTHKNLRQDSKNL